jgi:hypothetical protein
VREGETDKEEKEKEWPQERERERKTLCELMCERINFEGHLMAQREGGGRQSFIHSLGHRLEDTLSLRRVRTN